MAAVIDHRDHVFRMVRGGLDPPTLNNWYINGDPLPANATPAQTAAYTRRTSPHPWNAYTIVRGFNITPKRYYHAENHLKALLYPRDTFKKNFKSEGFQKHIILSSIIEAMQQAYPWLEDKSVPLWFRTVGVEHWVVNTAGEMKGEKYKPGNTRKVVWSHRRPPPYPKFPEKADPYHIQRTQIVIMSDGFETRRRNLQSILGLNPNGTINWSTLNWEAISSNDSPIALFDKSTEWLSYLIADVPLLDDGSMDMDYSETIQSSRDMKVAITNLYSRLGKNGRDLIFQVDDKSE